VILLPMGGCTISEGNFGSSKMSAETPGVAPAIGIAVGAGFEKPGVLEPLTVRK